MLLGGRRGDIIAVTMAELVSSKVHQLKIDLPPIKALHSPRIFCKDSPICPTATAPEKLPNSFSEMFQ
jgi:hypothetical protein